MMTWTALQQLSIRRSMQQLLPICCHEHLPRHDEGLDSRVILRGFEASSLAVTVGFEPTVGGYPTQLFESCTFGRSDTSPPIILREDAGGRHLSRAGSLTKNGCLTPALE